jgi:hypothetical protein
VAKVNGRTKEVAGKTYHLVAIRYEAALDLLVSGSRGPFWLVNGEFAEARMLPPQPEESPKGDPPHGVRLLWLRLPPDGQLEVLYGVTAPKPGASPAQLRQQLLKDGYRPFVADVAKLPAVQVQTAAELAERLPKAAKSP